jgi:hypothetical protein
VSAQDKYERRKAASEKAAKKDRADKTALAKKVNQKGGAGKLSRAEIKLAKRSAPCPDCKGNGCKTCDGSGTV